MSDKNLTDADLRQAMLEVEAELAKESTGTALQGCMYATIFMALLADMIGCTLAVVYLLLCHWNVF